MLSLTSAGFAYALTGNIECGNSVKQMLLYLSGLTNWSGEARAPFEQSFIVTQMVISYDLVNPLLSDSDRERICEAIRELGLKPLRAHIVDRHSWQTQYDPYRGNPGYLQYSNQAPSYFGAIFLGNLLLYKVTNDEKYKHEFMSAIHVIQAFMRNYFGRDGGTAAATGYYFRTLQELAYIIKPMAVESGKSVSDFIPYTAQNPFAFPLHFKSNSRINKGGKSAFLFAFGDSTITPFVYNYIDKAPPDRRYTALCVWSAYVDNPELRRLYQKYVHDDIQYIESATTLTSHYYRSQALRQGEAGTAGLGNEVIFRDAGIFLWRDGFNVGDKLIALAKRVNKPGDHLHYDQNVLYLEAYGERYLTDRGVNYSREKFQRFSSSEFNNAVTVNKANNIDGNNRIEIKPYLVTEYMNYALSDASYVSAMDKDKWRRLRSGAVSKYTKQALRSLVYVKPNYYILIDDLGLKEPQNIEENFVSENEYTINNGLIVFNGVHSRMEMYIANSRDYILKGESLLNDKGDQVYGLSVRKKNKVKRASFASILYPYKNGEDRPVINSQSNPTGTIIYIKRHEYTDVILKKNRNEKLVNINGYVSDADIAVLAYKGGNSMRIGIFGGASLMFNKKKLIDADKRLSLVFGFDGNNVHGEAQVQEGTLVKFGVGEEEIQMTLSNSDRDGYVPFASFH